jgi:hypothetical protein
VPLPATGKATRTGPESFRPTRAPYTRLSSKDKNADA